MAAPFQGFSMSKSNTPKANGHLPAPAVAKAAERLHAQMVKSSAQKGGRQKERPHAMKIFSAKAFEHLLFGLHRSAYEEIDRQLQGLEERYPGGMADLCKAFDLNFANPTSQGAILVDDALVHGRPTFDIHLYVDESEMKRVRKCEQVAVKIVSQSIEWGHRRGNGNHLIVTLKPGKVLQSFIVPLPLVLMAFEARVCKPNTYQVYEHTLIRKKEAPLKTVKDYQDGAGHYVGLTSRTWQQRAKEHAYATENGSRLLFHCALRGDLFDVFVHEHIVLRAGLNRSDALRIEEAEVEERTLNNVHPNGLNMIPGGEAGLRFLSTMTKRPAASIDPETVDSLLEDEIKRSLGQPGLSIEGAHSNAKLAELWKSDIDFRIKTMTGQANRLSYGQIKNARIWQASGWTIDKILAHLNEMDDREVTLDQLQRLLDGKTYRSIPHVLINY